MLKKVKKFIEDNNLIDENKYVICAISGGVDSICLLDILYKMGYKPVLAHVNHHKRRESITEASEMEALANKLNIPFEILNYYDEHKKNFQSEAHFARYDFFKKIAYKYNTNIIATAHHLDDQIETIIMKLITGSNLYGYAGISIKVEYDNYKIIRPLLCTNKQALYEYAKLNNLTFFEDSSNKSDDYLRNRIRHHIVPLLKEENINVLSKFQEFSVLTKEAFNFIRNQSINYLNQFQNNIELNSFNCFDIALKKDIICLLFERFNLEKNNATINKCLALLEQKNNRSLNLKNNLIFKIEYGYAQIKEFEQPSSYYGEIDDKHDYIALDKYHFYFSKKMPQNNAKYIKLCYNSLKLPLKIRNRRMGDFIQMSYGNKKVARVMIDAKISSKQRDTIPLVYDSCDNLLWVYNIAKSKEVIMQKSCGDIFLVCEEINYDE